MKVTHNEIDIENARIKKQLSNRKNTTRRYNKLEELQTIHGDYIEERERLEKESKELEKLNNYWKC